MYVYIYIIYFNIFIINKLIFITMAHTASHIAKYLIHKANEHPEGELLTNMKLQKLLYYCQGFYLALTNEPLFEDEVSAWQYGPVVPSVYREYKEYGYGGINPNETVFNLNESEIEIVDEVFEYFNQYSAIKLMNMTHEETPWVSTEISTVISQDKMKNYFKNHIN